MLRTKRQVFFSQANTSYLVRRAYHQHIREGGQQPPDHFQTVIPHRMRVWPGLAIAESYETVDCDLLTELGMINRDFLRYASPGEIKTMSTPDTVEGYRQRDSRREPAPDYNQFQVNRALALQQKMHSRNTDRAAEAAQMGVSHEGHSRGFDMGEYLSAVSRPYTPYNPYEIE